MFFHLRRSGEQIVVFFPRRGNQRRIECGLSREGLLLDIRGRFPLVVSWVDLVECPGDPESEGDDSSGQWGRQPVLVLMWVGEASLDYVRRRNELLSRIVEGR